MLRVEPAAVSMYAKHRGMFRKQGIDATLTPVADPSQLVASLLGATCSSSASRPHRGVAQLEGRAGEGSGRGGN